MKLLWHFIDFITSRSCINPYLTGDASVRGSGTDGEKDSHLNQIEVYGNSFEHKSAALTKLLPITVSFLSTQSQHCGWWDFNLVPIQG